VGNKILADFVATPKGNLGENYRVTHYNDPVPRLPPAAMRYAHFTPEIYIAAKNQKAVVLTDVAILDGSTTSRGNDQFVVLSVAAHRWYFNAISACYDANTNKTTPSSDLATTWAGTMIQLMGNNSGIMLEGSKAANKAGVSAMAGLLASMSTSAAKALLEMIPGGYLVLPYLPKPRTAGALTAVGTSGLISALQAALGQAPRKLPPGSP
jgi:hypothetical protein